MRDVQVRMTRDEILAGLNAKMKDAEKADQEILREHRAAEKAYHAEWKKKHAEAARWNYETIKENHYRVSMDRHPHCPSLHVPRLKNCIMQVERSNQKSYTLTRQRYWYLWDILVGQDLVDESAC